MLTVYVISFLLSFFVTYYLWRRITFNFIVHAPLIVVSILYEALGRYFSFNDINGLIYIYFSLFVLIGAIVESLVLILFRKSYSNVPVNVSAINVPASFFYLIIIICAFILTMASQFGKQYGVASDEFEQKMASGLIGHLLVFLMISPPFIYVAYLNKNIGLIKFISCMVLIFTCLFLKQVKSWVMIPLIYFFFSFIYYNGNIKKRSVIIYSLIASSLLLLLFFAVYIFKQYMHSPDTDIASSLFQIFRHFLFYFFSGIGAFSEYLNGNILVDYNRWYLIFLPIVNVFNLVTGEPLLNAVNPLNFVIDSVDRQPSNVLTMFGTLWDAIGYYSFLYYSVIVFIQGMLSIKSARFETYNVYLFICSFGVFSWFEYYYYHLTTYEGPVYIFILSVIFSVRRRNGKNVNYYP